MDLSDLFGKDNPAALSTTKVAGQQVTSMMPGHDEFDVQWQDGGIIDDVLQGRSLVGAENTALQALTQKSREANALQLPVKAGTRVQFEANLGSVLAYKDCPGDKMGGTVITVRSADGDLTAFDERVHVMWDDGQFRAINAEHLRLSTVKTKQASAVRIGYFSGMGDLSSFFEQAKVGSNDLIHKATKDLWSFRDEGEGNYVIERLFDEAGGPLKG